MKTRLETYPIPQRGTVLILLQEGFCSLPLLHQACQQIWHRHTSSPHLTAVWISRLTEVLCPCAQTIVYSSAMHLKASQHTIERGVHSQGKQYLRAAGTMRPACSCMLFLPLTTCRCGCITSHPPPSPRVGFRSALGASALKGIKLPILASLTSIQAFSQLVSQVCGSFRFACEPGNYAACSSSQTQLPAGNDEQDMPCCAPRAGDPIPRPMYHGGAAKTCCRHVKEGSDMLKGVIYWLKQCRLPFFKLPS